MDFFDLLNNIGFHIAIIFYYSARYPIIAILVLILCFNLLKAKSKNIKSLEDAKRRTSRNKVFFIIALIFLIFSAFCMGFAIYDDMHTPKIYYNDPDFVKIQEREAFNNVFESYAKECTGANLKALISRLIANEKTYKDNFEKEVVVAFDQVTIEGKNITIKTEEKNITKKYNEFTNISNNIEEKVGKTFSSEGIVIIPSEKDDIDNAYINALTAIRNHLESKHTYYVTFSYQESGLIDAVMISYDKDNVMNEIHRKDLMKENIVEGESNE